MRIGTTKNPQIKYFFDIEKCKQSSQQEGCYKLGAKSKTYGVTILSNYHQEQENFQETAFFKERLKIRYKMEAKHSELKHQHGYHSCDSAGFQSMQIQGAISIFVVNLKRIIKLLEGEVCPKINKMTS